MPQLCALCFLNSSSSGSDDSFARIRMVERLSLSEEVQWTTETRIQYMRIVVVQVTYLLSVNYLMRLTY